MWELLARRRTFGKLLFDLRGEFVAHSSEDSKFLVVGSSGSRRIVEAPVDELVRPWEYGASLPGMVTNGHDVGNVLAQERDDILRLLA